MQKKTVVTLDELRLYQCIFPLVRDKTTRAMILYDTDIDRSE